MSLRDLEIVGFADPITTIKNPLIHDGGPFKVSGGSDLYTLSGSALHDVAANIGSVSVCNGRGWNGHQCLQLGLPRLFVIARQVNHVRLKSNVNIVGFLVGEVCGVSPWN